MPTPAQLEIALLLGIDVSSDSEKVAAARIREKVAIAIGEPRAASATSDKQRSFAKALGINIDAESMTVGSAMIDEALYRRNQEALAKLALRPGDKVIKKSTIIHDGEVHNLEHKAVVSSIRSNLRVYFKGGNGQGAWPTQLVRDDANENGAV
jgi:hypothetical protein